MRRAPCPCPPSPGGSKRTGVKRIIITTDDPENYKGVSIAGNCEVWHRDRLLEAQSVLAAVPGVTALIHDQQCAAEKRRLRKRGRQAEPPDARVHQRARCARAVAIAARSRTVSPCSRCRRSSAGRRRFISPPATRTTRACSATARPSSPSSPSGSPRKSERRLTPLEAELPEPVLRVPRDGFALHMMGIGGTGVVTVNQILGTAAMLDGRDVRGLDQTGLSPEGRPGGLRPQDRLTAHRDLQQGLGGRRRSRTWASTSSWPPTPSTSTRRSPGAPSPWSPRARSPPARWWWTPSVQFPELGGMLHEHRPGHAQGRQRLSRRAGHGRGAVRRPHGRQLHHGGRRLPGGRAAHQRRRHRAGDPAQRRQRGHEPARLPLGPHGRGGRPARRGRGGHGHGAGSRRRACSPPRRGPGERDGRAGRAAPSARDPRSRADRLPGRRLRAAVHGLRRTGRAGKRRSETPGRTGLAEAVARHLYKLMAYKDEYEVARLHLERRLSRPSSTRDSARPCATTGTSIRRSCARSGSRRRSASAPGSSRPSPRCRP